MKVRNIIRKAAVLGASATMLGATVMGALAYNLADYPAQFVVDGQFDGKIVVGEKAATSDVLGAIDIAASLQAGSVTTEEVEIPGMAGEVSLNGDAFRIETGSDLLEVREVVGDVYDTLTSDDLEALRGGSITTDEGNTGYNQYLRLADTTNSLTLQKMAVNYAEDEDRVLGDYLVIKDVYPFFEWEIEFTEGLESSITANQLNDLEDEVFNIFGTDFTFVDSTINTTNSAVTLSFMAGDVSDTLREGETKTYTIDGVDYEVTAVFISDPNNADPQAKFAVNGELTDGLGDGDTDTLSGGLQIGVRDLLVNSREGVVEFFLGANKIEFVDTNYASATLSNGEYAGSVEIGNENIEDASIAIVGETLSSDSKFKITSIKYRLKADAIVGSIIYVPSGHGVREFLDEPTGLLSPTFDIRYEGLKTIKSTDLRIEAVSDHSYELGLTSIRGKTYDGVPFITNKDGTFYWGDDQDDFWFTEPLLDFDSSGDVATALDYSVDTPANVTGTPFFVSDDDYFALSESAVAASDEKTDSAIFRYEDIDTSDNILSFTDMSSGETREVTYSAVAGLSNVLGVANNFVVEGQTYKVWIANATGYALAIDLNGDGNLTAQEVGFTAKGGAVLDFGNATQVAGTKAITGTVNLMNMSIPGGQFDESTASRAEAFWWTISQRTNNQVGLATARANWYGPNGGSSSSNDWSYFDVISDDAHNEYDRALLDFGALVEYHNPTGSDEAEELTISMPETQVGAQVFVVAGVTSSSEGSAGSVMRDVVNPIAVGMAVLDVDAPALGDENLIIVGGPAINTVAAEFLGNPEDPAEGFEPGKAMISAMEYGNNVAILVAGYEAQETLGASYVLADYATYLADVEGSEVEVVASDLSDLQVMTVDAMTEE